MCESRPRAGASPARRLLIKNPLRQTIHLSDPWHPRSPAPHPCNAPPRARKIVFPPLPLCNRAWLWGAQRGAQCTQPLSRGLELSHDGPRIMVWDIPCISCIALQLHTDVHAPCNLPLLRVSGTLPEHFVDLVLLMLPCALLAPWPAGARRGSCCLWSKGRAATRHACRGHTQGGHQLLSR